MSVTPSPPVSVAQAHPTPPCDVVRGTSGRRRWTRPLSEREREASEAEPSAAQQDVVYICWCSVCWICDRPTLPPFHSVGRVGEGGEGLSSSDTQPSPLLRFPSSSSSLLLTLRSLLLSLSSPPCPSNPSTVLGLWSLHLLFLPPPHSLQYGVYPLLVVEEEELRLIESTGGGVRLFLTVLSLLLLLSSH